MIKSRIRSPVANRPHVCVAFTLIELLVVIGITSILLAVLLPYLSQARAQGRLTQCLSNLRSQGVILRDYTDSYEGAMPPRVRWNYLTSSGSLINTILATHMHDEFVTRFTGYGDWRMPTGVWRCPEVARDSDFQTHHGILHYAPVRWLFNTSTSYDGEEFETYGDILWPWNGSYSPSTWRHIDEMIHPSDTLAFLDNVSYFDALHQHREARASFGFSREIEKNPDGPGGDTVRGSHDILSKRPGVFLDGHAEAMPSTHAFWENAQNLHRPRGSTFAATPLYDREVKHLLWFIGSGE